MEITLLIVIFATLILSAIPLFAPIELEPFHGSYEGQFNSDSNRSTWWPGDDLDLAQ